MNDKSFRFARIIAAIHKGASTAQEIAAASGMDEKNAANRLGELRAAGLIESKPIDRDSPGRCRVAWGIA